MFMKKHHHGTRRLQCCDMFSVSGRLPIKWGNVASTDLEIFVSDPSNPSRVLAVVIEKVRQALGDAGGPDAALQQTFIKALACLIRQAMGAHATSGPALWSDGPEHSAAKGDPVFQAQVLRHQSPQVDDYVVLSASIRQDQQSVLKAVNAVAHPGKQRQLSQGWQRSAMAGLYDCASNSSWIMLGETIQSVLVHPQVGTDPALEFRLKQLRDHPGLQRLQRLQALEASAPVVKYLALCDQQGPRAGSDAAAVQGLASRQRGQAVEAAAAAVLGKMSERLNSNSKKGQHTRVVTSMHAPATLVGGARHAKSEWDAVLLKQSGTLPSTWDVCLLVEAKSTMDAAITDFPVLLRGLERLAAAGKDAVYPFETREGTVNIRGASLATLSTDKAALKKTVRYFCDVPPEPSQPRILSAANRMRLLSAPACLEFAGRLMHGADPDLSSLEPVWRDLLESPRMRPVLQHYPVFCLVRELMLVH